MAKWHIHICGEENDILKYAEGIPAFNNSWKKQP